MFYPELIDGVFNVDRFMKDLKYLYQIFVFYYDFVELVKGNPDRAFNHYQEGRHFDTLPFFEEYKSSDWKPHKNPTREDMENAPTGHELLKEMMDDAKTMSLLQNQPRNNSGSSCSKIKKESTSSSRRGSLI